MRTAQMCVRGYRCDAASHEITLAILNIDVLLAELSSKISMFNETMMETSNILLPVLWILMA